MAINGDVKFTSKKSLGTGVHKIPKGVSKDQRKRATSSKQVGTAAISRIAKSLINQAWVGVGGPVPGGWVWQGTANSSLSLPTGPYTEGQAWYVTASGGSNNFGGAWDGVADPDFVGQEVKTGDTIVYTNTGFVLIDNNPLGTYYNTADIVADFPMGSGPGGKIPVAERYKSHFFLEVDTSAGDVNITGLAAAEAWVKDGTQISFTVTDATNTLIVQSLYGNVSFFTVGDVATLTYSAGNGWFLT